MERIRLSYEELVYVCVRDVSTCVRVIHAGYPIDLLTHRKSPRDLPCLVQSLFAADINVHLDIHLRLTLDKGVDSRRPPMCPDR